MKVKMTKNEFDLNDNPRHKYFTTFAKYFDALGDYNYRRNPKTERFLDAAFKKFGMRKLCKVLEVGVGSGRLALPLVKLKYEVTGVDLNKPFMDLARKKAKKAGLKLILMKKDMRQLNFDNEFDAVFLGGGVFYYLDNETDAGNAFAGFYKSLCNGGILLLDMPNWERMRKHFIPTDLWESKTPGLLVRMHNKHRIDLKTKTFVHTSYVYVNDKGKIKRCIDVHKLHMWTQEDLMRLAKNAGFSKLQFLFNKEGTPTKFDKYKHPRLWLCGIKDKSIFIK